MTPAAIIEQAAADGVHLSLNAVGRIKATGEAEAVNRWLSVIRETKPQIITVLQQAAEGTANHWRVHFPNREPLEIFCSPDASKRQVLADYPAAVAAEAIPDTPKHKLPLSPELESLVRKAATHYDCPPDELELMREAAHNDPEGALTYYQQFAALEVETLQ